MQQGNKIRFAVIGIGHIGKQHAAMILQNKEADLVAVCDIDIAKVNQDFDQVPFYSTLEDLLSVEKNIDVICIATPNGLHQKHATMALNSWANVEIEKPMALSKSVAGKSFIRPCTCKSMCFVSCKTGILLHLFG